MQDSPAFPDRISRCQPCLSLDSVLSPVPRYPTLPSESDSEFCLLPAADSSLLCNSAVVNKVSQTNSSCVLHLGPLSGRYNIQHKFFQAAATHLLGN